MTEIALRIDNMHCGACVRRVTQALERVPGVNVEEVRVGAARVKTQDPAAAPSLVQALAKAGYPAHPEQ